MVEIERVAVVNSSANYGVTNAAVLCDTININNQESTTKRGAAASVTINEEQARISESCHALGGVGEVRGVASRDSFTNSIANTTIMCNTSTDNNQTSMGNRGAAN